MTECVNNPFWCSLTIEVENVLANTRILEEVVAARAGTQRVSGICKDPIVGSFKLTISIDGCGLELRDLKLLEAFLSMVSSDLGI